MELVFITWGSCQLFFSTSFHLSSIRFCDTHNFVSFISVNVYVPKDRVTNAHQGYGFVEFRSEEDADYVSFVWRCYYDVFIAPSNYVVV